ncbi:MAG: ABC transporter permease, partial [Actinomycetota bacterium]
MRNARRNNGRPRSKVRITDQAATGTHGLRSRRGRTLLTAIGIAIGIASMISVLGISSSSKADLIAQIDRLGTNLLQVQAGQNLFGDNAKLPAEAPDRIRRIGPVENATSVSKLSTTVKRTEHDDKENGLDVLVAEPNLVDSLDGNVKTGRFLQAGTDGLPTVVLGSVAAERLGITSLDGAPTVTIGGRQFAVVGILDPFPLS